MTENKIISLVDERRKREIPRTSYDLTVHAYDDNTVEGTVYGQIDDTTPETTLETLRDTAGHLRRFTRNVLLQATEIDPENKSLPAFEIIVLNSGAVTLVNYADLETEAQKKWAVARLESAKKLF